tara:strand:+ start:1150 stop:1842 length:693 start_codon:yes stop_codon:yes gene_type:complete
MSGWVAGAIVVGAGVAANSSSKASDAQAESAREGMSAEERMADRNLEFQLEMADQQRSDFEPWRNTGEKALNYIWEGVQSGAFTPGNINLQDDPGYQVRMQEGIDAVDASASARGRLLSGAQNKALTQFGQDQGSKEYAAAYAREANEKSRKFNMLSGISAGGQASAAGQAQATGNLAQTEGNILSNLGRSQNQGHQNIGKIRAGAYQGVAKSVNKAAQNWVMYKTLGDS